MLHGHKIQINPDSTVRSALLQAASFLESKGLPEPRRDAELLLSHLLSRDRTFLLAHPEHRLTADQSGRLAELCLIRGRHYPIQYITGVQEFYGRDFWTTPATLIPRPETELLVDACLRLSTDLPASLDILDVGTGTGCVALTLLLELPGSRAVAGDISISALRVASTNASRLGCRDRVLFANCDLLAPFVGRKQFHLIVSNPPYVSCLATDVARAVREHEPYEAVFAGPTGLEVYRRLLDSTPARLAPEGFLVLELGAGQRQNVLAEARKKGWEEVSVQKDLAGHDRCAVFRRISPREAASVSTRRLANVSTRAS